jgi:cephalosporin-C deacetylase-like acetyl esterase
MVSCIDHTWIKGKLDNYAYWGVWNQHKYYYKGVITRIMRALEYVKSLPEWDGKNLLVYGASQGGTQSIVAAALDPQVTYCHAGVPALCDHNATYADRTPGWPCVVRMEKGKLNSEKKWFMVVLNYYDVAHFAKRVKCEISVSAGLLDHTCSPTSVMAAYNNISKDVQKSIQISLRIMVKLKFKNKAGQISVHRFQLNIEPSVPALPVRANIISVAENSTDSNHKALIKALIARVKAANCLNNIILEKLL